MPSEKLKQEQRTLALWAANCAEHVLPYFEKEYPGDNRPRKAIEAARSWVRGETTIGEARTAAIAAHAAARNARHPAARAAARASGHAAATAHVASHAPHAADYSVKAAEIGWIVGERLWQCKRLPKRLRSVIKKSA